jgi:hypothetical protein
VPALALILAPGGAGAAAPAAAGAPAEAPPRALACLVKWYPLVPVKVDGAWHFVLAGTVYRWDDGRRKSFEEKLESPDLEDTFSLPYVPGPIAPVARENEDPGRIRFDPLFRATYGASKAEVDLVAVDFVGQALQVHRKAAPAFARVASRLEAAVTQEPSLRAFLRNLGAAVWRTIGGTRRQSAHSWGVAIDLDAARSHYWRWVNPREPVRWGNAVPRVIVDAFEAEGFIWGGRWYHYDTMHFEYRPELLDPACR